MAQPGANREIIGRWDKKGLRATMRCSTSMLTDVSRCVMLVSFGEVCESMGTPSYQTHSKWLIALEELLRKQKMGFCLRSLLQAVSRQRSAVSVFAREKLNLDLNIQAGSFRRGGSAFGCRTLSTAFTDGYAED